MDVAAQLRAARERRAAGWRAEGTSPPRPLPRPLLRWVLRNRLWLGSAAVAVAALVWTQPDPRSFPREGGAWRRATFTDLHVLTWARSGGVHHIGLLGRWVALRLPGSANDDVVVILAANALVFLGWQSARRLVWMSKHFTCTLDNIRRRPWTLLTASFSHASVQHLCSNMYTLSLMAPIVQSLLGRCGFLALYLGGGMAANAGSLLMRRLSHARTRHTASLGASGGLYALMACNAVLNRRRQFSWWLGMQLSGVQLLFANVAMEFITTAGGVDVPGHAFGAAAGGLAAHIVRQRRRGRWFG